MCNLITAFSSAADSLGNVSRVTSVLVAFDSSEWLLLLILSPLSVATPWSLSADVAYICYIKRLALTD